MAVQWRSLDRLAVVAGLAAGLSAGVLPAAAQDERAEQPATAEPADAYVAPTYTPSWSSAQISRAASLLTGAWKSRGSVGEFGGDGASGVVLSIAPAPVQGMTDTLYVEAARADSVDEPYRTAIYQLFEYQGAVRLRTYEMTLPANIRQLFTGMWAAPEFFPTLSREQLIATMDVALTPSGDGFTGKSPHPYPTGVGGAVEMTSEVTLTPTTMTVADRGMAADGSLAWGSGEATVFEKQPGPIAPVSKAENGMVIVEFVRPEGEAVADGDRLHVHYRGYMGNLSQFDASYDRDRPFIFNYPPGTRAITGWGLGMENATTGTKRKLVIPGYLGYGERGNPRAGIPGDATLYFNTHVVLVEKPEPAEGEAVESGSVPTGSTQPGHEGHDHD